MRLFNWLWRINMMSASTIRLRVVLGLLVAALLVMAGANSNSSYAAAGRPGIAASGQANPPGQTAPTAVPNNAPALAGCSAATGMTPATAAAYADTNASLGHPKICHAISLSRAAKASGASHPHA